MKIYTKEQMSKKIKRKEKIKKIIDRTFFAIIFMIITANVLIVLQRIKNPQSTVRIIWHKNIFCFFGKYGTYDKSGGYNNYKK